MKNYAIKLIGPILLLFVVSFFSCTEDDPIDNNTNNLTKSQKDSIANMHIRGEILSYMQQVYYWHKEIPKVDTLKNVSPEEFFYSLLYTTLDQWSFIVSKQEYTDLMNGVYFGHGISFSLDNYGNYLVAFVFNNTSAFTKGVRRGWIVKKINGTTPINFSHFDELLGSSATQVTNKFEFLKPNGSTETVSLTKESVTMNAVLANNIINAGTKKIGYIAVETFLGDIEKEFKDVFLAFKNAGINELVIDLRYNGGGSLGASGYLANLVGGAAYSESIFCKIIFNELINDSYTDKEKTIKFEPEYQTLNAGLKRIFFITNSATASASETLIKGLEPFFNTYIIGTRTLGKPVGMFNIELTTGDYTLMPITFEWRNSLNQSCPYTGIPVDFQEFDDFSYELGDTSELCLKQAIHFIKNGKFDSRNKSMPADALTQKDRMRGLRAEIGAY